jgi:Cdc6-like AAA superfamily ATPase
MVKYFSIKHRTRKEDNTNNNYKKKRCAELYFREKNNKMSKKEKATYISKSKNILISGEVASGKTKELIKLYRGKEAIYDNLKVQNKFIYFDCNVSLSEILQIFEESLEKTTQKFTAQELQVRLNNIEDDDEEQDNRNSKTLYTKIKALEEYSKGAILFIDDINKATGRKLETLKHLVKNSKIWIATTKSSHTINQNLQKSMNLKNKDSYYNFTLYTTQAVDATNILFIIFILFLVAVGQTDMAILLMAGRFMLKQGTGK